MSYLDELERKYIVALGEVKALTEEVQTLRATIAQMSAVPVTPTRFGLTRQEEKLFVALMAANSEKTQEQLLAVALRGPLRHGRRARHQDHRRLRLQVAQEAGSARRQDRDASWPRLRNPARIEGGGPPHKRRRRRRGCGQKLFPPRLIGANAEGKSSQENFKMPFEELDSVRKDNMPPEAN